MAGPFVVLTVLAEAAHYEGRVVLDLTGRAVSSGRDQAATPCAPLNSPDVGQGQGDRRAAVDDGVLAAEDDFTGSAGFCHTPFVLDATIYAFGKQQMIVVNAAV